MKPLLPYKDLVRRYRRRLLRLALRQNDGCVLHAAEMLGLDRCAMHVICKKFGIDTKEFRPKSS